MYQILRPLIFRFDPERAHHITLKLLALPITPLLAALFKYDDPRLTVSAFGLTFKNPVGLAAGYDKNGAALRGLAALGFGHLEAGTVTRQAQPGNSLPRIFRLPGDEAVINRMGFPNEGVEPLLRQTLGGLPCNLGINIGKSKATPLEQAADDYTVLLKRVALQADYVAVNVSSPNTPGLRQLQTKAYVSELLQQIALTQRALPQPKPVLVKIAPDLSWPELDDILEAIQAQQLQGVIATNTTLGREGLHSPANLTAQTGGLSGKPVQARSTEMIRYIYKHTQGKLPIVGAGGINGTQAALGKIRAGATLVQIYTGMIYAGPGLVKTINKGLIESGVKNLAELVGVDA